MLSLNADLWSVPDMLCMLFFALLCGHAVADYCLQSDYIAKAKSYWSGDPSWFWVLSAHSLTHGGAVWIVTGEPLLALLETVCHWVIDHAKCAGKTNIHQDQVLHVVCKAIWAIIWVYSR